MKSDTTSWDPPRPDPGGANDAFAAAPGWHVELARTVDGLWRPVLFVLIAVALAYAMSSTGAIPGAAEPVLRLATIGLLVIEILLLLPDFLVDLVQTRWGRIWAISGVCFQESIRRRVLWITPLTILGVIIVSQLQKPFDEQDAIRQTIKYCLFATGLLVVMTGVILAATNLPKEIDSRVIYTLVTKPVTRLEIVLGKVLGFARVSAAILLIMGLFTYAYVQWRSLALVSAAKQRLSALSPTDASRPTLEHYVSYGLLHAKTYARPVDLQQYADLRPSAAEGASNEPLRWINGGDEQNIVVPFDLPNEALAVGDEPADPTALELQLNIHFRPHVGVAAGGEKIDWPPKSFPRNITLPSRPPFVYSSNALVAVNILGPDAYSLFGTNQLPNNGAIPLKDNKQTEPVTMLLMPTHAFDPLLQLPDKPPGKHRIWVQVAGGDYRSQYGIGERSVRLRSRRIELLKREGKTTLDPVIEPAPGADGRPSGPVFRGRTFLGSQQLRGVADPALASIAVFRVRGSADKVEPDANGQAPVELRFPIEGTGDEANTGKEVVARASLEVFNVKSGRTSPAAVFPIESNRSVFVNVPAEFLAGGNYDIRLRCLAAGNTLTLRPAAIEVVVSEQSFMLNLLKSLFVLWLMAVLVVTAAVFCSTFVSWPIAVVLTVLILLGRWGIDQVSDSSGPGLGNIVTRDLFPGLDAPTAKTLSSSIEGLSSALSKFSRVLPDISAFSATEEIERGVNMPRKVLVDSLKVILWFALPMTLLAYVILKKKEVAP